jgi:AraC family transcriptional regulator
MLPLALSALSPTSSCVMVARTSATEPEFVLADHPEPGFVVSRWRRRSVLLNEPTRLDDHLLSYCARGGATSTVVLEGVRLHARQQAGSVTFLPAGRPMRWLMEAPGEVLHVHLYISKATMHDAVQARPELDEGHLPALMNVLDPWLDGFFRLMVAEYESCRREGRLDDFDFLDRNGSLLMHRLVTLQGGRMRPAVTPSRVTPLRPVILRRVECFVEDNLDGRITLDDMAEIASMSVDHFVRAFQAATGSTPHQHLLERRLDRACALLRSTTDRIAVIAHRSGFAGAAHFSATFHDHYGMTPSEYRRRS